MFGLICNELIDGSAKNEARTNVSKIVVLLDNRWRSKQYIYFIQFQHFLCSNVNKLPISYM